jgi:hypothetical protein
VERPRTISGKSAKKRHGNTKPKRSNAPTAPRQDNPSAGDLQKKLDARTRQLNEALERENATAEVLRVISSSAGQLEPVFQAMLANATKLCEASYGTLWLCEGDGFRAVALHGGLPRAFTEQLRDGRIWYPSQTVAISRVARTRQAVQVADLRATAPHCRLLPSSSPVSGHWSSCQCSRKGR